MSSVLLLSFSLNPQSRSLKALEKAYEYLELLGFQPTLIDMREYELPFYDGTDKVLSNKQVNRLVEIFNGAKKIIISTPIYNFDVNAALKNFIDILSVSKYQSKHLTRQTIAFIGAMGSEKSYMSLLPSLVGFQFSLGFYCLPKIVICVPRNFDSVGNIDLDLEGRIRELCNSLMGYD